LVTVLLLIRGSILEVTGYRNAPHRPHPNPYVVLLVFVFLIMNKMMFLEFVDMYLMIFVIFSQYLVIALLIHQAIIAVTITDSGDRNKFAKQLIR
jgi:hypothetical protein